MGNTHRGMTSRLGFAVFVCGLVLPACPKTEPAPAAPVVAPPQIAPVRPLAPGEVAAPLLVPGVTSYRLGDPAALPAVAMRARALWQQPEFATLRIQRMPDGKYALYTATGVSDARASELGIKIKGQASASVVPPDATLIPHVVRSNVTYVIRTTTERNAPPVRIVARGSVTVLVEGIVEGVTSVYNARGDAYIAASMAHGGFASSRLFRDYDDCMPDLQPFLNDVAPDRRAAVEQDLIFSTGAIRSRFGVNDGYLVLARDAERSVSYFGAYKEREGCVLERAGFGQLSGFIDDGFLSGTEKQRGETLIMVAWHPMPTVDPEGFENWNAIVASSGLTVWSQRYRSSKLNSSNQRQSLQGPMTRGPDNVEGFWPVRVASPDNVREYLVWSETTLVSDGVYSEGGGDDW